MAIGFRINPAGALRGLVAGGAAAVALVWSGHAGAFEVKKTPSGQDIRWPVTSVTYHLDSSVDESAEGAAAAIIAAASSWSGLQGAPALSVVRGGGGDAPGFDGINTVFFAPEGSKLTGGALAVTVLTYDGNGHVLDADIVINGRYHFAVLPADATPDSDAKPISNEGEHSEPPSARFDLHHVVAHELGHSLGLADETADRTALMFLYSAPGAASPRAPTADDTSGVASLYDTGKPAGGSTTGGSGCGGASVSPRGPTNASSRFAFALALGLAVWALARRYPGAASRPLALSALLLTTLVLLPGENAARPSPGSLSLSPAHATTRARVTHVEVSSDAAGLFSTRATLRTTACPGTPRPEASCPGDSSRVSYGGTIGQIHQEVVGTAVPREGDELEIAFEEKTSP